MRARRLSLASIGVLFAAAVALGCSDGSDSPDRDDESGGAGATGGLASSGGGPSSTPTGGNGNPPTDGGASPGAGGTNGTGGAVPPRERPPEPGGLCTRCVDDADCAEAGSRCVELFSVTALGDRQTFGERVCGRDCSTSACPEGFECRSADEGGQQCFPLADTCAQGHGYTYGGYPRLVYVEYADGTNTPSVCEQAFGTAAPYACEYGASVADCQRLLKGELDRIYADFNVEIVFERPEHAPYYHAFVASDWPLAGWSRFADCRDRYVRTDAVECMYGGGRFLEADAVGVAHEVGHTMGMDHVEATTDIMHGTLGTLVNGVEFELNAHEFQDLDHVEGFCAPTQNSYRFLLDVVGPRP